MKNINMKSKSIMSIGDISPHDNRNTLLRKSIAVAESENKSPANDNSSKFMGSV